MKTMTRTQIYLTREEDEALGKLAARTGCTRSALIREAVDRLIERRGEGDRQEALRAGRGLWRGRDDLPDFAALRGEWDREAGG